MGRRTGGPSVQEQEELRAIADKRAKERGAQFVESLRSIGAEFRRVAGHVPEVYRITLGERKLIYYVRSMVGHIGQQHIHDMTPGQAINYLHYGVIPS